MAYNKKQTAPDGLALLKADLKNKAPGRLYFFYGEEAYLRSSSLGMLRKQRVTGPAEEFNFHRFTQENWSRDALQDAVEALPMMAERTMIQVDDYDLFKANENDRDRLVALVSDLPDYCCVVFYYETVEFKPDKRMKKLYEAMTAAGTFVEFRKQEGRELMSWVRRHFLRQKKEIDDRL